jgi:hypothetical protein
MVDAPQPTTHEGHRPSYSNSFDESKPPSHWREMPIHASYGWQGDRVEGQIRMRAVIPCRTGVHPGCEQPSSCWVLCVFWLLAPEYFSFWSSPSTIQPTSDVFAELRRYFCGNSVCGSKSPRPSPCNRRTHLRFDLNVSYLVRLEGP